MELNDGKIKVIAYYLPQFHPIKENDEWWGKGFTEWTNVGKARPLFRGHYQPKIPADLGYYDLRVPEVAEQQAALAREAGVAGFCYWHYWFGNGRKLLEMPAERMIASGKPDFPFCFSWANHNWYSKSWTPGGTDKILAEQTYPGPEDIDAHFYYCLPAFKDKRYMRYNDQPVFMIFNITKIPDVDKFIERWNYLIKKENVAEKMYFVANIFSEDFYESVMSKGFDAMTLNVNARKNYSPGLWGRGVDCIKRHLPNSIRDLSGPQKVDYNGLIASAWHLGIHDRNEIIPEMLPNWDHTPRSGRAGSVYVNATPENFYKMAHKIISEVNKKQNKLIILKSWNEWGEGNYMEPDSKYGHGYIKSLAESLKLTK